MKQRIEKLRKWLIVKLGGYVMPPVPVVRFDRVNVPIRTIFVQNIYPMNCPHSEVKRLVAKGLADQICDAGLVKYEYQYYDRLAPLGERVVRATIRVIEPQEGGYAE